MSDLGPGIYAVQTVFAPDRNLRNHLGNVNVVASTRDTWEFRMVPGGYFVIVHQPVNGTELVLGTLNRNVAHGVRVVLQARDDSNRSQRWLVVNQGTVGNRRAYNISPFSAGGLVISANGTQNILSCDLGNRINNEPRQMWYFDPA